MPLPGRATLTPGRWRPWPSACVRPWPWIWTAAGSGSTAHGSSEVDLAVDWRAPLPFGWAGAGAGSTAHGSAVVVDVAGIGSTTHDSARLDPLALAPVALALDLDRGGVSSTDASAGTDPRAVVRVSTRKSSVSWSVAARRAAARISRSAATRGVDRRGGLATGPSGGGAEDATSSSPIGSSFTGGGSGMRKGCWFWVPTGIFDRIGLYTGTGHGLRLRADSASVSRVASWRVRAMATASRNEWRARTWSPARSWASPSDTSSRHLRWAASRLWPTRRPRPTPYHSAASS